MKKLKNARIRKQLLAGFLTVSLFSLVLAAFGLYGLWSSSRTEESLQKHLMSMPYVSDAVTDISWIQSEVSQAVLEASDGKGDVNCDQVTAEVRKYDKLYQTSEAKLEAGASDAGWKEKIGSAKQIYSQSYIPMLDQVLSEVKKKNSAGATSLLQETIQDQEGITKVYADYTDFSIKAAQSAYAGDHAKTVTLFTVMAALGAVSILFQFFWDFAFQAVSANRLKSWKSAPAKWQKAT